MATNQGSPRAQHTCLVWQRASQAPRTHALHVMSLTGNKAGRQALVLLVEHLADGHHVWVVGAQSAHLDRQRTPQQRVSCVFPPLPRRARCQTARAPAFLQAASRMKGSIPCGAWVLCSLEKGAAADSDLEVVVIHNTLFCWTCRRRIPAHHQTQHCFLFQRTVTVSKIPDLREADPPRYGRDPNFSLYSSLLCV